MPHAGNQEKFISAAVDIHLKIEFVSIQGENING